MYLIDFEMDRGEMNGLQVIEHLGIASQSILVTSRFEDAAVLDGCRRLGCRYLPKTMAAFVPIKSNFQDVRVSQFRETSKKGAPHARV